MDDLTREQWKPVVGYEGRYEVSDMGRVRSLRFVNNFMNRLRAEPKILRTHRKAEGYLGVWLPPDRTCTVHRLVLEAFVGPCPPDKDEIAHLDGNKLNPRLSNLVWATKKENMAHMVAHGRSQRGKRRSFRTLTESAVREIRSADRKLISLNKLARQYGVCRDTVSKVINRKTWRHI